MGLGFRGLRFRGLRFRGLGKASFEAQNCRVTPIEPFCEKVSKHLRNARI